MSGRDRTEGDAENAAAGAAGAIAQRIGDGHDHAGSGDREIATVTSASTTNSG